MNNADLYEKQRKAREALGQAFADVEHTVDDFNEALGSSLSDIALYVNRAIEKVRAYNEVRNEVLDHLSSELSRDDLSNEEREMLEDYEGYFDTEVDEPTFYELTAFHEREMDVTEVVDDFMDQVASEDVPPDPLWLLRNKG